ncbi:MAG: hypothetical protein LH480_09180 [Rubrivivax sp.]|nr:hypothetical protein [Rubrivivax sp.]
MGNVGASAQIKRCFWGPINVVRSNTPVQVSTDSTSRRRSRELEQHAVPQTFDESARSGGQDLLPYFGHKSPPTTDDVGLEILNKADRLDHIDNDDGSANSLQVRQTRVCLDAHVDGSMETLHPHSV